MLTGSVAAAYHGATRATMDVDLVIEPTALDLERFVRRTHALGYDASIEAAHEALAMRALFNVIDPDTGWKADVIVRKARAFSEAEFARREEVDFLGVPVAVARAEDLIIAKLEWAALGASARQLEDVRLLLRIGGAELDRAYMDRWVRELRLTALWEEVQRDRTAGRPVHVKRDAPT